MAVINLRESHFKRDDIQDSLVGICFHNFSELFSADAHWLLAKELIGFLPLLGVQYLFAQIRNEGILNRTAQGPSFFGSPLISMPN
jgi:hypothetical protein